MLFRYWTVRIRPTPMNISSIGAGVIIEDPQSSTVDYRFADNLHAILGHFPNKNAAVKQIKHLRAWLDAVQDDPTPRLSISPDHTITGVINTLVIRWNNLVVIDSADYMAAPNISDALNLLFTKLIGALPQIKKPARSLPRLRREIKNTYESYKIIKPYVESKPTLITPDALNEDIDLGIIKDDCVYELNQAFSFQSIDQKQSQHRLEAWTWKVALLRDSGAELQTKNNRIALRHDTPIVATFIPPDTPQDKQLMDKLTRQWERLEVSYFAVENLSEHVHVLADRVS